MLTDTKIKALKPKNKEYKISDEKGLYILVKKNGSKLWRLKYRIKGREKTLSIGIYPDVKLKLARQKRDEARELLAIGGDPSQQKQIEKEANADTFNAVADKWLKQKAWSDTSRKDGESRIDKELRPVLGKKPLKDILAADLRVCLNKIIDRGALETARRCKQIYGQIARYGIAQGYCDRDVSQDLKGLIPPRNVKHHAAITEPDDVKGLLNALDGYTGSNVTRAALLFSAYTFQRQGEIRHAEWCEIDGDLWRIPAGKMKMKLKHLVPLSSQALKVLEQLKPFTSHSNYIFPSERTNKRPMSENTVNAAIRRLGYTKEEMTAHGFRGMASTLLNERGYNRDWIERQLAHVESNEVRKSYNHAKYLEGRKKMMQDYADYLDDLKVGKYEAEIFK